MIESNNYKHIERAILFLKENYQNQPSLQEIANVVGTSPSHCQKMFLQWAGVSPKDFIQFLTVTHAKQLLKENNTLLATTFDVGLSSTSRLHDLFIKIESLSPGQYKTQADKIIINYEFYETLFGKALIAETDKGICHCHFIQTQEKAITGLKKEWPKAKLIKQKSHYAQMAQSIINNTYSSQNTLAFHLKGTSFQIKVWEALLRIPRGNLVSYQTIANTIKKPKANRAVGSAIGKNPIAYLIPCHRVIRNNGILGDYRWNAARKTSLIAWESAQEFNDHVSK